MASKLQKAIILRNSQVELLNELKTLADLVPNELTLQPMFKIRCKFSLDRIYDEFKRHHEEILLLLAASEEGEQNPHKLVAKEFENDFYLVKTIYHSFDDQPIQHPQNNAETAHIRLPKVNLIEFGGDVKKWKSFIDMFNATIHNNASLSNIEKFNYLISCLHNEPLALVKCIPMSNDNYMTAYDSLISRYDNTRLIATAHFNAIDNAPTVTNSCNSTLLRKLLNIFTENIAALTNLGFPTDQWDFILFNLLLKRLDSDTRTRFELAHTGTSIPSFNNLKEFLTSQCNALENTTSIASNKNIKIDNSNSKIFNKNNLSKAHSLVINANSCPLCDSPHRIYNCNKFLSMNPSQRFDIVRQNKWCFNCLGSRHTNTLCKSQSSCKTCHKRHHSLLHFENKNSRPNAQHSDKPNTVVSTIDNSNSQLASTSGLSACSAFTNNSSTVLLSTAVVEILDNFGNYQTVRILLDTGSQLNFMSEKCSKRLKLPVANSSFSICGIGQQISNSSKITKCTIRPCNVPTPKFDFEAIVLAKICNKMPSQHFSGNNWSHIKNLELADPNYNVPGEIDILLGAEMAPFIFKTNKIVGSENSPSALDTHFGWVLMGKANFSSDSSFNSLFCSQEVNLELALKRFWEIEQVPLKLALSTDDVKCEKIFLENVKRDIYGRYTVSLPFRIPEPSFENSREIALRRFYSLERRLTSNPDLYKMYSEYMLEYLAVKHMELVTDSPQNNKVYYIPHSPVIRPDAVSTKLRIVYDASCKNNNISLNDTLLTGEKMQQNIISILLKFRCYPFVLTADIRQMYRQIFISPEHRDYQRILWRFSPSKPINEYRLNTVTFGLSCSPFLAIRTLRHLAENNSVAFPLASQVLLTDTYVDDIVTGSFTRKNAIVQKTQLIHLLASGGFELRKWVSNDFSILSDLPDSHVQTSSLALDLENDSIVKILGLKWQPSLDTFSYSVKFESKPCTKRNILSQIARIYDPLGFLSPLTLF